MLPGRLALALGLATACRAPCPEPPSAAPPEPPSAASPAVAPPEPPPAASPAVAPPRPAPSCTLTRAEADAHAIAALTSAAGPGHPTPPAGFTAKPCVSHCLQRRDDPAADVACDRWTCPYHFGAPQHFLFGDRIDVEVLRCGAQVFMWERLAACFARPHGCRFAVDHERAKEIARARGEFGPQDLSLRWNPAVDEFQWSVKVAGELLRLSAHVDSIASPRAPRGAP